ncbi:hypothetical protein V7111_13045 [Neobacillus niacini]|uniref:hypothetical protein n=1 Tax=Neobacillus niacini TaxID=86668 RepID=UPI003000BBAD
MDKKPKDQFPILNNGSMAQNFEEMKKLGKEMEGSKTNQELKEEKQIPDPKQ